MGPGVKWLRVPSDLPNIITGFQRMLSFVVICFCAFCCYFKSLDIKSFVSILCPEKIRRATDKMKELEVWKNFTLWIPSEYPCTSGGRSQLLIVDSPNRVKISILGLQWSGFIVSELSRGWRRFESSGPGESGMGRCWFEGVVLASGRSSGFHGISSQMKSSDKPSPGLYKAIHPLKMADFNDDV
ncbi:hypothetical protein NPIL_558421 [Nephila pilipes]|uniref:Uncharacterized protein n=1 Tax=Nephila pilipes TaxID=299642 RepID=A0A8X6PA49_NEPPI|nr:hypothetical protein NPIL_558421 [Nephila pilipes]